MPQKRRKASKSDKPISQKKCLSALVGVADDSSGISDPFEVLAPSDCSVLNILPSKCEEVPASLDSEIVTVDLSRLPPASMTPFPEQVLDQLHPPPTLTCLGPALLEDARRGCVPVELPPPVIGANSEELVTLIDPNHLHRPIPTSSTAIPESVSEHVSVHQPEENLYAPSEYVDEEGTKSSEHGLTESGGSTRNHSIAEEDCVINPLVFAPGVVHAFFHHADVHGVTSADMDIPAKAWVVGVGDKSKSSLWHMGEDVLGQRASVEWPEPIPETEVEIADLNELREELSRAVEDVLDLIGRVSEDAFASNVVVHAGDAETIGKKDVSTQEAGVEPAVVSRNETFASNLAVDSADQLDHAVSAEPPAPIRTLDEVAVGSVEDVADQPPVTSVSFGPTESGPTAAVSRAQMWQSTDVEFVTNEPQSVAADPIVFLEPTNANEPNDLPLIPDVSAGPLLEAVAAPPQVETSLSVIVESSSDVTPIAASDHNISAPYSPPNQVGAAPLMAIEDRAPIATPVQPVEPVSPVIDPLELSEDASEDGMDGFVSASDSGSEVAEPVNDACDFTDAACGETADQTDPVVPVVSRVEPTRTICSPADSPPRPTPPPESASVPPIPLKESAANEIPPPGPAGISSGPWGPAPMMMHMAMIQTPMGPMMAPIGSPINMGGVASPMLGMNQTLNPAYAMMPPQVSVSRQYSPPIQSPRGFSHSPTGSMSPVTSARSGRWGTQHRPQVESPASSVRNLRQSSYGSKVSGVGDRKSPASSITSMISSQPENVSVVDSGDASRLVPSAFAAVRHNMFEAVERMLRDKPALIDAVDTNNRNNSLLHVACMNGYARITKLLVKSGASVNATNTDGNTPLHLAYQYGRSALVSILIAAHANENARNGKDQIPSQLSSAGSTR